MTSVSVPNEDERLLLVGRVVIQGLVFTWTCKPGVVLKVQHPQYGIRTVPPSRHYEPETLAKLTALSMLASRTTLN